MVIKLRPNTTIQESDKRGQINSQLIKKLNNVIICKDLPSSNILSISDAVVSCHSSATGEGMYFGATPVILDLFPILKLSKSLKNYNDSIICKNIIEVDNWLREIDANKASLSNNRQYFQLLSEKYILKTKTPIQNIGEFIVKTRSLDCSNKTEYSNS